MAGEEFPLSPEIQILQTRLDMSANLFKQIPMGRVEPHPLSLQIDNVLRIYNNLGPDYRLETELTKSGYDKLGGEKFNFVRRVKSPDGTKYRYILICKAPVENIWQLPPNSRYVELSRKDYPDTGESAFELMHIGKGTFSHGEIIQPENVLAMKIMPVNVPLPKAV